MLACGLILEWCTWRATFVATAVLAAVAFVAALVLAPNTADPDEAVIDLPGYLLSGIGIGALVYAHHRRRRGGLDDARMRSPASASRRPRSSPSSGWELRTPRPMLDVRLFALRGFSTGTLALTVQFLCLFGFFLVGLQFLQLILGYSPLHSALVPAPDGDRS